MTLALILMFGLAAFGLLFPIAATLWQRLRRPVPTARQRALLRAEAQRLARRGRIAAITSDTRLPGAGLKPLGEVWLTRPAKDQDATDALAQKAVRLFPEARALTGLTVRPHKGGREWRATACGPRQPRPRPARAAVLIDGSNVVNWEVNAGLTRHPSLRPLIGVIDLLLAEGHSPRIIFDASIGHRLGRGYQSAADLKRQLNRPAVDVSVVDKGTNADTVLLATASRLGADIVTNDLYRDHARPPEVQLRPGFSIGGEVELCPTAP